MRSGGVGEIVDCLMVCRRVGLYIWLEFLSLGRGSSVGCKGLDGSEPFPFSMADHRVSVAVPSF